MKAWIINKLGGYTEEEVLTTAVKDLYNTISKDDVLQTKGAWTVGGKPLPSGKQKLIIAEARVFLKTTLWDVLQKDISYKANKSMFESSTSEQDLVAGKLWLYTLDCIRTKLNDITAQ